MEFTFSIGLWGILALIVGSAALGVIVQLIGEAHYGYEWLLTAVVAGIGAFVASEFVVDFRTFEPVFDGLALVPALIAGGVAGVVAAAATRFLPTESYGARPVS